jgi:hypothetical protein
MINPFKDVNWKPQTPDLRRFGVTLMIGFPIIAVLVLFVRRITYGAWNFEASYWLAGIGFAVGFLFFLIPSLSRPFYFLWFFLACCIGIVLSNVLMSVFFLTLVTCTGLIMRTLGKLSFRKHPDKSLPTYWRNAPGSTNLRRYFRQF